MPRPVSYTTLQKKYAGKIVALTDKEDKVVAAARKFDTLFKKIAKTKYDEKDSVYIGPVEKYGQVSVYHN